MNSLRKKGIDRKDIFNRIKFMIENSPNQEAEVSTTELAEIFGVQGPTMDYHLNKILKDGWLDISSKRGKYKRKIYMLPDNPNSLSNNKKRQASKLITPENEEIFQDFLTIEKEKLEKQRLEKEKLQSILPIEESILLNTEDTTTNKIEYKQIEETPLDEKIQLFLDNSSQVHDATVLLNHEDKEILSVMNETIHQTGVYLKDLSEQLSTIQNKELIQGLIEDRNRMQNQMKYLEDRANQAEAQASKTIDKYEIDPSRVRFMHQLIISTIDDYINLPNHAIAIGRTEFRNKTSKEVSDLVKYVLRLEE